LRAQKSPRVIGGIAASTRASGQEAREKILEALGCVPAICAALVRRRFSISTTKVAFSSGSHLPEHLARPDLRPHPDRNHLPAATLFRRRGTGEEEPWRRHVFVVLKIDRTEPDMPEVWVYETREDAEAKLEALTIELCGEGVIELYRLDLKRTVH
jgi:hypothetical protein